MVENILDSNSAIKLLVLGLYRLEFTYEFGVDYVYFKSLGGEVVIIGMGLSGNWSFLGVILMLGWIYE